MKTLAKSSVGFLSGLIILLAGCDRKDSSKGEQDVRYEPGGTAGESDDIGFMGLRIVAVHVKQKTLDYAPWFADGGDWTFLECESAKDSQVRAFIGTKENKAKDSDAPVGWGEAMITVTDSGAGARFVEAFAKAFHQAQPPSHGNKPTLQVKCNTAVLGHDLIRERDGGFKPGRGSWAATKWFIQTGTAETEVFYNFSAAEKRAEFSEKDEEYREDLVGQLVVGLRDGPLPERTFENDPSLTRTGPTINNWIKVGSSNDVCRFSRDGKSLLIVTSTNNGSQLFVASISNPTNRTRLAEFVGTAYVRGECSDSKGTTFLVSETVHANPKRISSGDPQKLWLIDQGGKHEISPPAAVTNWFIEEAGLSPDGKHLALGSWKTDSDKKRKRVIHLGDTRTGKWRETGLPDTLLELIGWIDGNRKGFVLTGLRARTGEIRKPFSLDLETGDLTPLASIPREFIPGHKLSPDGKRDIEVVGKERIVITEADTGQHREFVFHPYDRHSVYPDSVWWVSDDFLVFDSEQTSLIAINTLKMNYPATKESGFSSVDFSPDFKVGLGVKAGEHYLGRVALVNGN